MRNDDDKLDKILENISRIDVTLARQNVTLEEHVRRTELLEDQVRPIGHKIAMFEGALKLLGVLGILAAIVEGIVSVFHK